MYCGQLWARFATKRREKAPPTVVVRIHLLLCCCIIYAMAIAQLQIHELAQHRLQVNGRDAMLDDFDIERHAGTGFVKVHGAGDSAALLIGRRRPGRLGDQFLGKVPVGVPVALIYVLTYAGQSRRTSALIKQVEELQFLGNLPDHPSIVRPLGFFLVEQDFRILGMYLSFRASQAPVDHPHQVHYRENYDERAIVIVRPLFQYTLCDQANRARSFVHCFPDEAAEKLPVIFRQLREAVAALDERCVAHNDIKENNIVVSRDEIVPDQLHVGLTDYGEARKFASKDLTLADGDFPCGGNPLHKLPSTAAGGKCYKNADFYALKFTEQGLERFIFGLRCQQLLAVILTKDDTIQAKDHELQAKERTIEGKNQLIQEGRAESQRKDQQLEALRAELRAKDHELQAKERTIEGKNQLIQEGRAESQRKDQQLEALRAQVDRLQQQLHLAVPAPQVTPPPRQLAAPGASAAPHAPAAAASAPLPVAPAPTSALACKQPGDGQRVLDVDIGWTEDQLRQNMGTFPTKVIVQLVNPGRLREIRSTSTVYSPGYDDRKCPLCTVLDPTSIIMDMSMLCITTVGDRFLRKCTSLEKLDLSGLANVQTVGYNFLVRCTALAHVQIAAKQQSIEARLQETGIKKQGSFAGFFSGCTYSVKK